MEMVDIKAKKDADLEKLLKEWQQKVNELQREVAMMTNKNVRALREARKTVARIKTELTQRSKQAANQA